MTRRFISSYHSVATCVQNFTQLLISESFMFIPKAQALTTGSAIAL